MDKKGEKYIQNVDQKICKVERPLRRHEYRWEDNINIYFQEIG
jgi:hypothetical protein